MKLDINIVEVYGIYMVILDSFDYIADNNGLIWPNTVEGRAMSKYSDAKKAAEDAKRDVDQVKGRGQKVPDKFLHARDAETTKADLKAAAEISQGRKP